MKADRNAPCPCGSGKKFKKFCLDRDAMPNPADSQLPKPVRDIRVHIPTGTSVETVRASILQEIARTRKFGHVKPVLSLQHHGRTFVAVGNALYHAKDWKTFPGLPGQLHQACLWQRLGQEGT
jgi:hypothetical protein